MTGIDHDDDGLNEYTPNDGPIEIIVPPETTPPLRHDETIETLVIAVFNRMRKHMAKRDCGKSLTMCINVTTGNAIANDARFDCSVTIGYGSNGSAEGRYLWDTFEEAFSRTKWGEHNAPLMLPSLIKS